MRQPVPSEKRLAMTLYYLAHRGLFAQLALMYSVGKSTAQAVVHSTVSAFRQHLVSESIRFPQGEELRQVVKDFECLAGLPQCAGADDGTFMRITKPRVFGDTYWCYKQHVAILLLAVVDARGIFTDVNTGGTGSVGDAAAYNTSRLARNVQSRKWLGDSGKIINGKLVHPFLVGDSAFALSTTMMKCYGENDQAPHHNTFNWCLIRTRRVVEQAFGHLKGRFHVLTKNNLFDPSFAAEVAIVCCTLHNVCERWSCTFEDSWLVDPQRYDDYHQGPNAVVHNQVNDSGVALRDHLATFLHT